MRAEGLARDGYIFGEGSGFRAPYSGWGKSIDRLREGMPEGDPWLTLHDIRRTVATCAFMMLASIRSSSRMCSAIWVASAQRGYGRGRQARAVTLTKQREALKSWAAKRLALFAGDNVIPLRQSA